MVFWAKKRAENSSFGTQLGLGAGQLVEAMLRGQLMPTFCNVVRDHGPPHVLLRHLGENLGCSTSTSLRVQAAKDINYVLHRYGGMWSCGPITSHAGYGTM